MDHVYMKDVQQRRSWCHANFFHARNLKSHLTWFCQDGRGSNISQFFMATSSMMFFSSFFMAGLFDPNGFMENMLPDLWRPCILKLDISAYFTNSTSATISSSLLSPSLITSLVSIALLAENFTEAFLDFLIKKSNSQFVARNWLSAHYQLFLFVTIQSVHQLHSCILIQPQALNFSPGYSTMSHLRISYSLSTT